VTREQSGGYFIVKKENTLNTRARSAMSILRLCRVGLYKSQKMEETGFKLLVHPHLPAAISFSTCVGVECNYFAEKELFLTRIGG
jgi:hypothetical protein